MEEQHFWYSCRPLPCNFSTNVAVPQVFLHKLSLRQIGVTKNNEDFNTRPSKIVDTQKVRLKMIHVLLLINDSYYLYRFYSKWFIVVIQKWFKVVPQKCLTVITQKYLTFVTKKWFTIVTQKCLTVLTQKCLLVFKFWDKFMKQNY